MIDSKRLDWETGNAGATSSVEVLRTFELSEALVVPVLIGLENWAAHRLDNRTAMILSNVDVCCALSIYEITHYYTTTHY